MNTGPQDSRRSIWYLLNRFNILLAFTIAVLALLGIQNIPNIMRWFSPPDDLVLSTGEILPIGGLWVDHWTTGVAVELDAMVIYDVASRSIASHHSPDPIPFPGKGHLLALPEEITLESDWSFEEKVNFLLENAYFVVADVGLNVGDTTLISYEVNFGAFVLPIFLSNVNNKDGIVLEQLWFETITYEPVRDSTGFIYYMLPDFYLPSSHAQGSWPKQLGVFLSSTPGHRAKVFTWEQSFVPEWEETARLYLDPGYRVPIDLLAKAAMEGSYTVRLIAISRVVGHDLSEVKTDSFSYRWLELSSTDIQSIILLEEPRE